MARNWPDSTSSGPTTHPRTGAVDVATRVGRGGTHAPVIGRGHLVLKPFRRALTGVGRAGVAPR